MSELEQMKLLTLGFMLILASKGQCWNISVPEHINATLGSDVTIDCTFTCPKEYNMENVKVYWKKIGKNIEIDEKEKNPFIYHTNKALVLEEYRHRTQLIGSATKGNCSLLILNVRENESGLYVRLDTGGKDKKYSFMKYSVSIFVSGVNETQPERHIYVAISVPVAVLVISIVIFIGIFCFVKHRRSHSLTRDESGYYANFTRPSLNQAKSEISSIKYEKTQMPQPKIIDEPVYINTEDATGRMDQRMELTETIYANVDYLK
ncbi:hypothetical protein Q5P01_011065 [Channa striata]|uniref:Ig-like domain-containing protein n=1 Tax=Channa striata TaxID=64152 RepID=A0AA88SNS4_CHASR|nr:hypothetical protein Q5P01_011065 [Channa striata]